MFPASTENQLPVLPFPPAPASGAPPEKAIDSSSRVVSQGRSNLAIIMEEALGSENDVNAVSGSEADWMKPDNSKIIKITPDNKKSSADRDRMDKIIEIIYTNIFCQLNGIIEGRESTRPGEMNRT